MSPAALVADTPLALERCELWLFSWAPPDSPQLPSFLQDLAPAVLEARSGQFTAASVHETAGGPPADFGAEYALFLEALQNLFERRLAPQGFSRLGDLFVSDAEPCGWPTRGSQAVRMFAYYMFDKIVVQPIQTILKLQRLTHAWIQQHASVTSEIVAFVAPHGLCAAIVPASCQPDRFLHTVSSTPDAVRVALAANPSDFILLPMHLVYVPCELPAAMLSRLPPGASPASAATAPAVASPGALVPSGAVSPSPSPMQRLPTSPEAAVSVPTAAAPVSSMEAIFSRARYMDHALHHLDEFESLYESLDNVDAEEAARMAQMVSDSAGSSSASSAMAPTLSTRNRDTDFAVVSQMHPDHSLSDVHSRMLPLRHQQQDEQQQHQQQQQQQQQEQQLPQQPQQQQQQPQQRHDHQQPGRPHAESGQLQLDLLSTARIPIPERSPAPRPEMDMDLDLSLNNLGDLGNLGNLGGLGDLGDLTLGAGVTDEDFDFFEKKTSPRTAARQARTAPAPTAATPAPTSMTPAALEAIGSAMQSSVSSSLSSISSSSIGPAAGAAHALGTYPHADPPTVAPSPAAPTPAAPTPAAPTPGASNAQPFSPAYGSHVVAFTPKHDPNSPMFAASPGRMHGGPVFAGAGPGSIADNTSPSESPGVSFGSPPFGHPDSGISTHPSPSAAHASAYLVHGHGHVHGGHASPARFGGPSGASPVGAALASNISTPSALAHGNAPSAGTLEAPADAYSAQLWTHLQTSQQHPLTAGAFGDRAMIDALHHPLGEPFEVRASVVQALVSDEADIDGPMALGQIMSPEWLPFRISLDVVFPGSAGVSAPHSPLSTASSPGPPPSPQNVPDQPARLRHRERYGSFGARWNYLPSASTRVSKRSGSTMAMTSAVSHLVRSTLQANTHVFFAGSSLSAESLVSIAMRRGGAAPKAATRTPIPLQDHPSVDRSVQLRFVDTVTVCAAPLAADPALYDFEPAWLFLSSTDSTVPFATLDQTLMDAIGANDDGVARTSDAASLAGPAHRRAAVAAATAAAVTTLTSAGSLLASSALPLLSSRHALAALWPPGAHAGAAVAPVAAAPPGGPGSGTPLAMRAWDLLPSSAPTRRSLSRVFGVLHDIFGDADATIKHADGLVFAQHDRMPSSDSCASSVSNTSLASAAGYLSRGTDLWRGRGVRGPITLFDYYDLQDADQGYTRIGGLQLRKRRRDADPPIEVVPPPNIQFRHDGALMSASVLSFRFWSKLRLEPFGGRKRLGWLAMFAVPIDVGDAIAAGSFSTPGAGTDPMSERARLLSAAVARWMSEFQNEWAANRLGECVPFALRQASTVTVHIPAELAESHESDGAAVRGVISLFVQAFDDTLCTLVTQFLSRAQSESMVFGDEADFVPPSQPNTPSHLTAAQQLMMHHHHHHQQQQQQQRRSSTKPCTHLGLFVFVPPNLFAHGRFGRNPLSGAPFRAHTRGKAAASSAQSAHPTQQCAQVAQSYSPTNPPLRQWTAIRNRLIDIISKRTGFRSDTVRARIAFKAVPFGYLDAVMPPVASARDCHQVYNQCHWVLHSPLASEVVATHVARVSEPARSPAFVIPAPSAILDDPQDSKQVFLDAGGESVELVEKADLERRVAEAGSEGGAGAGAGNATNGATAGSGLGAGQHHTAWQPASERLLTEPDRVLYLFYGAVSVHECKDGDDPSEMRHAVAAAASNASSALGSGSRPQSQQPQQPQAEAHWHGCRRNVMVRWTDHRGEYYGGFRLSAPESRPRASLLAHVLATVHERLGHSGFRFRIVVCKHGELGRAETLDWIEAATQAFGTREPGSAAGGNMREQTPQSSGSGEAASAAGTWPGSELRGRRDPRTILSVSIACLSALGALQCMRPTGADFGPGVRAADDTWGEDAVPDAVFGLANHRVPLVHGRQGEMRAFLPLASGWLMRGTQSTRLSLMWYQTAAELRPGMVAPRASLRAGWDAADAAGSASAEGLSVQRGHATLVRDVLKHLHALDALFGVCDPWPSD